MAASFDADLIPVDLVRRMRERDADSGPRGDEWIRQLPGIATRLLNEWGLDLLDRPARNGHNALVVSVRRDSTDYVLKVTWPHREAEYEHLGLQQWNGRGAVRLIAAQPSDHALLLEALRVGEDLRQVDIDQACHVIGALLGHLHVAPTPAFPQFRDVFGDWIAPLRDYPSTLPRQWAERALDTFDHRPYEPRLLHLDLHYENVLAADRDPGWLAIDPKPVSGPPGIDVYPALWNRADELGTGSTLRWSVQRRLEVIAAAAGIDIDDAREWSLVHAALNAHEAADENDRALASLHLSMVKVLADPF